MDTHRMVDMKALLDSGATGMYGNRTRQLLNTSRQVPFLMLDFDNRDLAPVD